MNLLSHLKPFIKKSSSFLPEIAFLNGVKVTIVKNEDTITYKYGNGLIVRRAGNTVKVLRQEVETNFSITNRPEIAPEFFPPSNLPRKFTNPKKFKNLTVLDAGCADGAYIDELRGEGVKAVGMDIAPSSDVLKKGYILPGDAFNSPFASSQFDVIFSRFNIFYYSNLNDKAKALKEFFRILKPQGEVRIDGMLLNDSHYSFDKFAKWVKKFGFKVKYHGPYYSKK